MARVLIGIVGYCQFVRGYPVGPELMERLRASAWPAPVDIREMNWGPIAIVQDLQANGETFDRVVLVGAVDRGRPDGAVQCRRWSGRVRDPAAVQRRMFEAVTGIISLDNLLVIGAHFGVWPDELFSVEAQLPQSCLGDVVLAEIEAPLQDGPSRPIGERAISPAGLDLVQRMVDSCRRAALGGLADAPDALSLDADHLNRVDKVFHYDFAGDRG